MHGINILEMNLIKRIRMSISNASHKFVLREQIFLCLSMHSHSMTGFHVHDLFKYISVAFVLILWLINYICRLNYNKMLLTRQSNWRN